MASSKFDAGENVLRVLQKICPFKANQIQILELIRSFLKNFFSCKGKWYIEDGSLKTHLHVIESVLRSSDIDLVKLWLDFPKLSSQKQWQIPMNMEFVINDLLEKFEHMIPEVQQVYTILSRTSRSIISMNIKVAMEILQSILKNTEDLMKCFAESVVVSQLKEELEAVQKTVRFLGYFLHFIGRRCLHLGKLKDTLILAESMADNISALLYLTSVIAKMDDDETVKEMKLQLRFQLQKFSPLTEPNVRKIYIKSLKISKLSRSAGKFTMVDELDLEFLNSIQEYAAEVSDKDQISSLHKDLQFLTQFFAMEGRLMEDQSKPYGMVYNFLEHTCGTIIDIACAVYNLSHSQDIVQIKEEYDMYLRYLLLPELPRSYKKRVRGYDLELMFEELTTYSAFMDITTKHQYEFVRDEILSLTIAFDKITAEQHNQGQKNIELRIYFNEIIQRAIYILERFFFSRGDQDWISKLMLYIIIKEMRKIKIELEDLEINMRHDTLGNNNKASGKTSAVKGISAVLEDQLRWIESDFMSLMSQSSSRYTVLIKNQISALLEELRFITYLAINSSMEKGIENDDMFKDLYEHTVSVMKETGSVIFSLNNVEKNEEIAEILGKKVADLQDILMVAKEDARKKYELYVPKSLWSNFPVTDGQGFIDTLMQNLKKLLNTEADLDSAFTYQIEIIQQELPLVMKDFKNISMQPSQSEEVQSLWTSFVDTAYQTEYVIDSFSAGSSDSNSHKLGLFNVIEEIKKIKKGLKDVETLIVQEKKKKPLLMLSSKGRLEDEKTTNKVGVFEKEAEQIREKLTNASSENLGFLWIVGMPGIGKTTLADSVFEHSITTSHFHVQAKCTVGHVHDKTRMFHEILHDIPGERSTSNDNHDNEDDLDRKVCQRLRGKRYLIFMDDMWDIQPWMDMKASFPDERNGSRIIFTSRSDGIASQIGSENITFYLSPISIEKSWQMLQMKLFGEGKSCPKDLNMVIDDIVENCKGLPLTIDLIAGILRETKKEKWEKVAESMKEYLFEDPQGRCKEVLQLSYDNLPDHLKPFFLYFAAFPEDANIPTRKLILLWIAEGLVQPQNGNGKSLEDVAMDILNSLISRSLITVSGRTAMGGVKESSIHDLLHEFVSSKAQEERFLQKIDGKTKFSTSSSSNDYQCFPQYRLCIYPENWNKFLKSKPSAPRARALILTNTWGDLHLNSLSFFGFKLLRVLDIPHISCYYCPTMFTLNHLKFLAILIFERKILSEIHKLQNLETLFIHGSFLGLSLLLERICSMTKLSHCYFAKHVYLDYHNKSILENSFHFHNLKTLYHIQIGYDEDIEKILKLMPNLKHLKVIFYNPDGDDYPFPALDFLMKLEFLEVRHRYYELPYPCKIIKFPPHLKKLALSDSHIPWTEISEMGNFEFLEILKLKYEAFVGPVWNMVGKQFPKLKYLSLCELDIEEFDYTVEELSVLEQLHVEDCKKLVEIPSCLAEITTLQKIKLEFCSKYVEESAKIIKEDQEDAGNEKLVVDITSRTPSIY